jgi:hypothetical protein
MSERLRTKLLRACQTVRLFDIDLRMKRLTTLLGLSAPLLLLFVFAGQTQAQLSLSAGQSYTLTFSSLDHHPGDSNPFYNIGLGLYFDSQDEFDPSDRFQLKFYEQVGQSPVLTEDSKYFYHGSSIDSWGYANPNVPHLWDDLAGAVELDVLSGSVILTSVVPEKLVSGSDYFTSFAVVPEPASLGLVCFGLVALGLFGHRRIVRQ